MKEFKLPIINEEERKIQWDNLKTNDKIVSIERNYWGDNYSFKYYTIVNKTPKGSVRLNNGQLLKAFYSNYYIITDELEDCIKNIELENAIMSLLFDVDRDRKKFKSNLEYEDAVKLKEILERTMNGEN